MSWIKEQQIQLRDAMRSWGGTGVTLFALGCSLALLFVCSMIYFGAEPVEENVVEPVADSLGVDLAGRCPGGWEDVSENDVHTLVRACEKDGWLVVLDQKGNFDHGFQIDTAGAEFKFDPSEVPGWPDD